MSAGSYGRRSSRRCSSAIMRKPSATSRAYGISQGTEAGRLGDDSTLGQDMINRNSQIVPGPGGYYKHPQSSLLMAPDLFALDEDRNCRAYENEITNQLERRSSSGSILKGRPQGRKSVQEMQMQNNGPALEEADEKMLVENERAGNSVFMQDYAYEPEIDFEVERLSTAFVQERPDDGERERASVRTNLSQATFEELQASSEYRPEEILENKEVDGGGRASLAQDGQCGLTSSMQAGAQDARRSGAVEPQLPAGTSVGAATTNKHHDLKHKSHHAKEDVSATRQSGVCMAPENISLDHFAVSSK
ncbi:unnamed protein product, partial [Amoebophrya sp. A25]|eukprot:GSA25T00017548001.1